VVSLEKQLGTRIAQLRKRAQITQAELAERVDVATETISRLERGATLPSLARLQAVARALGLELYELFDRQKRVAGRRGLAMDRLVSVMGARSPEDIQVIVDVASRMFQRWK
jgi:transcriptional regulator with XRE-family HTH domain